MITDIVLGVYYRHSKKESNELFNNILEDTFIIIKSASFVETLIITYLTTIIISFIDIMYPSFFQPCITEPTSIFARSKPSLIDSIFINSCNRTLHAGNLFDKISDRLPNFLLIQNRN